jgi:hypothetical protein
MPPHSAPSWIKAASMFAADLVTRMNRFYLVPPILLKSAMASAIDNLFFCIPL